MFAVLVFTCVVLALPAGCWRAGGLAGGASMLQQHFTPPNPRYRHRYLLLPFYHCRFYRLPLLSDHWRVIFSTLVLSWCWGVLGQGCWQVLHTPACPAGVAVFQACASPIHPTRPHAPPVYTAEIVNNQPISGRLKHLPRSSRQASSTWMLHRSGAALLALPCL